jgi:tripartite-type tricarboxylate transporter receptor subunit TctC
VRLSLQRAGGLRHRPEFPHRRRRVSGHVLEPPLAEAVNIPGYDIGAWIGYAAPPGTPREITARLAGEIQKAMQSAELRERYAALGMEPISNSPDEMGSFLKREQERYGKIIRGASIKVE